MRTHGIKADLVTVFGEQHEDPMETLTWRRDNVRYTSPQSGRSYRDREKKGWIGMGFPYTIPDLTAGETLGALVARRLRLEDLASALR